MGTITRSLSNNITTGGVIAPAGITNATVANITSFPNASGGTLILLSTQTASNSATISFTTGLDSTYDAYEFKFIDIHPRSDGATFQFNLSTDSGSNYNVTKTSTSFEAYNNEAGTSQGLAYDTGRDLAQSTSDQPLGVPIGNGADESLNGSMTLFNPSSTTYVKNFIINTNGYKTNDECVKLGISGYGNTTSACNAIRFQMSSGNFDGVIKLYGVKKS
jgi:hypothetical protein